MRKVFAFLTVATTAIVFSNTTKGQVAQTTPAPPKTAETRPTSDRVLGEVTAIDSAQKKISVRTDTRQGLTVNVDDKTIYRRIPPGETNVEKAVVINFADIALGDRVLARGKLDGDAIQTRILLVVSRSELARSTEKSRAEWQRRGIAGTINNLNSTTKEIAVRMRTSFGPITIRLTASGTDVRFKRYAPNSTRYEDATPGTFEQLQVGDSLRALGERSEDGESFKPEEIVSGSFRMAGGIITEVNQSTGEITIKDIQTAKPLTILFSKDSMLRRIPAELLARMEQSMETTAIAQAGGVQEIRVMTPNGPGIRRIRMPPPSQPGGQQPPANGTAPSRAETPRPPAPGGGVRIVRFPEGTNGLAQAGATEDYQETIEKLPPISIGDLKPGDGVIVSSIRGDDPSRVTVITLAAGLAEFIKRMEEAKNTRPGYDLDLTLPGLGVQ